MAKAKPLFKLGDPVSHPAHPDGKFPAGTGTVTAVNPGPDGFTYSVKSDTDGKALSPAFREAELSLVDES